MTKRENLLRRIISKKDGIIETVKIYENGNNSIGKVYRLKNSIKYSNQARLYATTWDESADGGWADKD